MVVQTATHIRYVYPARGRAQKDSNVVMLPWGIALKVGAKRSLDRVELLLRRLNGARKVIVPRC